MLTSESPTPDSRLPTPDPQCVSAGIFVVDHLCAPIARMPKAGELVMADRLPLAIGGCAANVAVDLARVGVHVAAAGCVGQDPFGDFVVQRLSEQGVDARGVAQRPGIETSGTLIINIAGEDRRFIHAAGASSVISADDIPQQLVQRAKILYVGGYLLMPRLEGPTGLASIFRKARQAGVRTMLDVVVPGPGDHWHKFVDVLPETDVFLPNTDEAKIITGIDDPVQQAERFRAAGSGTVVITCGSDGAVLLSNRRRVRSGVYPTTYVGGTGAGDAFDAGYIAGMLAGEDELGCLRWGAALGASCVRSVSASESVFRRDEALAFMREHELAIEDLG